MGAPEATAAKITMCASVISSSRLLLIAEAYLNL